MPECTGYPKVILEQFYLNFDRMASDIFTKSDERYASCDDLFLKDLAICRQKLVPAGAEVVEERSGIPRSLLFSHGPKQFASYLMLLLSQGGRSRPFCEYHTHLSTLDDFTPAGFDAFYLRVAELLILNLDIRGLAAATWFLDPVLESVSPHLVYVRKRPMQNGAKLFFVGPDKTGAALSKSSTRRKLYDEGKYKPMMYMIVWPRKSLIAWVNRNER